MPRGTWALPLPLYKGKLERPDSATDCQPEMRRLCLTIRYLKTLQAQFNFLTTVAFFPDHITSSWVRAIHVDGMIRIPALSS